MSIQNNQESKFHSLSAIAGTIKSSVIVIEPDNFFEGFRLILCVFNGFVSSNQINTRR